MTEKILKEIAEELSCIKNLLILRLLQDGASDKQISIVLKAKSVSPSNIRAAFPLKKLKKEN